MYIKKNPKNAGKIKPVQMTTSQVSPDDFVQGDEGGVHFCEAVVDRPEVGVAHVNHGVGGVQSA